MEKFVCSGAIPAVSRNRKLSEFRSEPFCRREKFSKFCTWNKNRSSSRISIPWNKNRSKLLEFHSKPFRGRENNSEFRWQLLRYRQIILLSYFCCFVKLTVPSLFRGIFSERNSVANPILQEDKADEINNLLSRYRFTISSPLAAKNDQFSEGDLWIFAQPVLHILRI